MRTVGSLVLLPISVFGHGAPELNDFNDCSPTDPTCVLSPLLQSLYANLGCPEAAPDFCESVDHAVNVIEGIADPAIAEEQYLLDLVHLAKGYSAGFYGASDKTCDEGDSESCNHKRANFPGPTAQSYLTNGEIRAKMEAVPELQATGQITRTNMLGFLMINDKFWFDLPEGQQGLGLGGQSMDLHRLVRPVTDRVFGEEGDWDAARIAQSAREFVDSKSQIDMKKDVKIWGQQVLHRIVFGIDISEEEAADFGDFQQKALITAVLPSFLVTLARSKGVEGLLEKATKYEEVKARKQQYLDRFLPITKERHCPSCNDLELSIVNTNLLDGLIFAGGLSVPGVLLPGIATLYAGDQSPAPGVQLSADNTEPFAWETARYFPAVLGFPYVDETKSQPLQIMALGMGQRSADVWGDDAESPTFRMRDMQTYYDNWVGHADFAEDPAGEMTRRCPGKSLSFAMIEGWYKAWDQAAWTPAPGTHFKFSDHTPFVNGFTMVRTARSDDLSFIV